MLLGIDVGGTFTDAVLIKDGRIISAAKKHTTNEDISKGLLAALDEVLSKIDKTSSIIKRVAISTTIITNAAVTNRLATTGIAVIPGPGYNCEEAFPVKPVIFEGYTDHRGGEFLPSFFSHEKIKELGKVDAVAVSAKFSVRNAHGENRLFEDIKKNGIKNIAKGHDMSGQLGFIRRTNSSYYTAATMDIFKNFIEGIKKALDSYSIKAPLYILKADGGTMIDTWAEKHTAEAFFTGPAASAMGVKALIEPREKAVSLDIGGTTTDIAFWEGALPLFAKRGARINGYPTSVRALQLHSLAMGGDSVVRRTGSGITIGPDRLGPAMALGGEWPTLTDAFLLLGLDEFGDIQKAEKAMSMLAKNGETPKDIAAMVMDEAISKMKNTIKGMIEDYAMQPVYRVADVVNDKPFAPEILIGVGGAAKAIVPMLAENMNIKFHVPQNAFVANAVGAALARPTIMADIYADTAAGEYVLPQRSLREKISRNFSRSDAEQILVEYLKCQAESLGMDFYGAETVWYEEFPVIRDSFRSGMRINMSMQLKPGVLYPVKGDGE